MAGRILGGVGIVEIGHLLVPLHGPRAAQVRPRHEGAVASHLELGLERVNDVGLSLWRSDRRAMVHQEDRDRACPLREVPLEILCGDGPRDDVELETAGVGDVLHDRFTRLRARDGDRRLARMSLPDGEGLAVWALDLRLRVVAPAHGHGEGARLLRHEEAHAHRRGEEALLRGLALLVRLLGETSRRRDLAAHVVVLIGVGARLGWRAGRDQEPRQVPVRRTHPAG